jgi:hypothetical protein
VRTYICVINRNALMFHFIRNEVFLRFLKFWLANGLSPPWPTYINEKRENFGQGIWTKVWCYWEHIGGKQTKKYPFLSFLMLSLLICCRKFLYLKVYVVIFPWMYIWFRNIVMVVYCDSYLFLFGNPRSSIFFPFVMGIFWLVHHNQKNKKLWIIPT